MYRSIPRAVSISREALLSLVARLTVISASRTSSFSCECTSRPDTRRHQLRASSLEQNSQLSVAFLNRSDLLAYYVKMHVILSMGAILCKFVSYLHWLFTTFSYKMPFTIDFTPFTPITSSKCLVPCLVGRPLLSIWSHSLENFLGQRVISFSCSLQPRIGLIRYLDHSISLLWTWRGQDCNLRSVSTVAQNERHRLIHPLNSISRLAQLRIPTP